MAELTRQSPDVATTALPVAGAWPLTAPLTRAVFRRLPLVSRLWLRVVCRATRAALSDSSLWEVLDASGYHDRYREHSHALRAASRLAAGGVRELRVSSSFCLLYDEDGSKWSETLLHVVAANAQRLNVLHILGEDSPAGMKDAWESAPAPILLYQLLDAAPQLEELHADVACETQELAFLVLRRAPFFVPLRVRRLLLRCHISESVAEAMQAHASCLELYLTPRSCVHGARHTGLSLLRSVVPLQHLRVLRISDNAEACGVARLQFLIRLLRSAPLEELERPGVGVKDGTYVTYGDWVGLCKALKRCTTLRRLTCHAWLPTACVAVLALKLRRHPRLEYLRFSLIAEVTTTPVPRCASC